MCPIAETDEEEGENQEKLININKNSKILICGDRHAMGLAPHTSTLAPLAETDEKKGGEKCGNKKKLINIKQNKQNSKILSVVTTMLWI